MFPPLPPFPPSYQQHHYMHTAMRMPPPFQQHPWNPPYAYGKNFVPVPPLRRQPFAPRDATPNMPSRRVNNAPPHEAARKVAAETRAIDKENQPPADPPRDENVRKPSYAQVLKADAKPFKMREPKPIWAIQSTRQAPTVLMCKEKKSIWTVTPLDLTSMMLLAHGKKFAPRRNKPQIKTPLRSNQETHECDQQSDGSSAASSDTDTEDEDVPGLKKCFGFPFLVEFPCDGEGDERNSSASSTAADKHVLFSRSQRQDPPVVLDYRKLFDFPRINSLSCLPGVAPVETASITDSVDTRPHMLWWPGDWKCNTCGNHNFSYRELCKRCREGRYDEAGFIFPLNP